jgi:hypothetical protein
LLNILNVGLSLYAGTPVSEFTLQVATRCWKTAPEKSTGNRTVRHARTEEMTDRSACGLANGRPRFTVEVNEREDAPGREVAGGL